MLTLRADVVLHADRHWRGNWATGKAGHFEKLLIDVAANPLFVAVLATDVDSEVGSGNAATMVPGLVKDLQGPIFPWEDKVVTLPLGFVHANNNWQKVGNESLPLLMRKWLWMHVRLEQDSRDRWLVWLDEQLTHGRLLG